MDDGSSSDPYGDSDDNLDANEEKPTKILLEAMRSVDNKVPKADSLLCQLTDDGKLVKGIET